MGTCGKQDNLYKLKLKLSNGPTCSDGQDHNIMYYKEQHEAVTKDMAWKVTTSKQCVAR
jgi:hypothetical protein